MCRRTALVLGIGRYGLCSLLANMRRPSAAREDTNIPCRCKSPAQCGDVMPARIPFFAYPPKVRSATVVSSPVSNSQGREWPIETIGFA